MFSLDEEKEKKSIPRKTESNKQDNFIF